MRSNLHAANVVSQLLADVLAVARTSDIAGFDGDKTRALASWIFAGIRLPATILSQSKTIVVTWIGELVTGSSPNAVWSKVGLPDYRDRITWLTSYQIVHHLWSHYPALFLTDTVNSLPGIFSRLVSSDPAVRANGVVALSGFAGGMLSVWSSVGTGFKATVLKEVRKFLFGADIPNKARVPLPGAQLQQLIGHAVREDDQFTFPTRELLLLSIAARKISSPCQSVGRRSCS